MANEPEFKLAPQVLAAAEQLGMPSVNVDSRVAALMEKSTVPGETAPRYAYLDASGARKAIGDADAPVYYLVSGSELHMLRTYAPHLILGTVKQLGGKRGIWFAVPGKKGQDGVSWAHDVNAYVAAARLGAFGPSARPPLKLDQAPHRRKADRDTQSRVPVVVFVDGSIRSRQDGSGTLFEDPDAEKDYSTIEAMVRAMLPGEYP